MLGLSNIEFHIAQPARTCHWNKLFLQTEHDFVTFENRINLLWNPTIFCPLRPTLMPTITFMCVEIDVKHYNVSRGLKIIRGIVEM